MFRSIREKIRIWHFLIAFLIFGLLSIVFLRQNNLTMLSLRDEVLRIDEETRDINQVEPALRDLANYVLNHMNTNMGTVELPGTFNAEVEAIQARVAGSGSAANAQIYAVAQERCEDPSILLTARAQCVQDFVVANSAPGTDPEFLEFPEKSLYAYSFASPTWSPDLAGFTLLATILSAVSFFVLIVTRVIFPFLNRMIDDDPLE